jgi:hypothetical protein
MRKSAIALRVFHGLVLVYFLACMAYLYYVGLTGNVISDALFVLVILTTAAECGVVYIFNNGDCPLIHIQRKLGDDVPFMELLLPKKIASRAIDIFAGLGIVSIILILFRFVLE